MAHLKDKMGVLRAFVKAKRDQEGRAGRLACY